MSEVEKLEALVFGIQRVLEGASLAAVIVFCTFASGAIASLVTGHPFKGPKVAAEWKPSRREDT